MYMLVEGHLDVNDQPFRNLTEVLVYTFSNFLVEKGNTYHVKTLRNTSDIQAMYSNINQGDYKQ